MNFDLKARISETPITAGFLVLIALWFLVEYWAISAIRPQFQYWFVMQSLVPKSPGWFLSVLSHGSIAHLAANVLLIGILGGWIERRVSPYKYLAFVLIGTYGANIGQAFFVTVQGGEPAIGGASGLGYFSMVLAPLMYFGVEDHSLPKILGGREAIESERRFYVSTMMLAVLLLAFVYPVMELTPLVSAGKSGTIGHLTGAVLGAVTFGLLQILNTGPSPRDEI